jgi:hypothetical protein
MGVCCVCVGVGVPDISDSGCLRWNQVKARGVVVEELGVLGLGGSAPTNRWVGRAPLDKSGCLPIARLSASIEHLSTCTMGRACIA